MARRNARYGNVKRGYALDLADGHYYASGWERDVARLLHYLEVRGVIEGWEYEPETFLFTGNGYKRGPWSYKPDFALRFSAGADRRYVKLLQDIGFEHVNPGVLVFWEVKGQETGSDRSKWRRFRSHVGYPLEIVERNKMMMLQQLFKPIIKEWESHIR